MLSHDNSSKLVWCGSRNQQMYRGKLKQSQCGKGPPAPFCPLFLSLSSLFLKLFDPLPALAYSFCLRFAPGRAFTICRHIWSSASTFKSWCCPSYRPRFNPQRLINRPGLLQTSNANPPFTSLHSPIFAIPNLFRSFSAVYDDSIGAMNEPTPSPSPAPVPKASPSPASGIKRKRASGAKFYAIKKGFKPGIYYSWPDCLAQITGYKGAICKLFPHRSSPTDEVSLVQS